MVIISIISFICVAAIAIAYIQERRQQKGKLQLPSKL
jgi:hypothetical protein